MSDKTQEAITRGRFASELENNPVYIEAYTIFEAQCFELWKRTTDGRERARLWQAIAIAGKLRDIIGMIAANGRVAEKELEAMIARQEREAT